MFFKIKILDGEYFWGGDVNSGYDMPICKDSTFNRDFRYHAHNQFMPLFISSKGRYVWSETGFKVWIENGELCFEGDSDFELYEGGTCLRDAYLDAMNKHFPFEETRKQGKTLPREFFKSAQFNCWTEFDYEPTQEKILEYAHGIIDNGFEPGILMIDEGWHTRYGQWKFDLHKFPDPKAMIDELHDLGFIVMLWVTPYVTADGVDFCKATRDVFSPDTYDKQFLRNKEGEVAIVKWWNGNSAILDLRKECDRRYLNDRLEFLMKEYGVDGFKCDGGDYDSYARENIINGTPADDHDQLALNQAWNEFGSRFKYHEYKDTYKGGGKPVIQRLCDREHSWTTSGILALMPCAILQGLFGYPFICPDMIGGGSWIDKYLPDFKIDEELFIRMAQCSALFPMMQFSLMPWKHLSKEAFDIVMDAYKLHIKLSHMIISEVENAEKTGEPILRSLEYNYPNKGYATITDQFMLGEEILVCPINTKGAFKKEIIFPEGEWQDENGSKYKGDSRILLDTPLNKLLWFKKISD
ncbi:MAG: glycoside hydrolase [Clostridia bacterium]|nr:glycoside hydrolase [Clostridia bacterium]